MGRKLRLAGARKTCSFERCPPRFPRGISQTNFGPAGCQASLGPHLNEKIEKTVANGDAGPFNKMMVEQYWHLLLWLEGMLVQLGWLAGTAPYTAPILFSCLEISGCIM